MRKKNRVPSTYKVLSGIIALVMYFIAVIVFGPNSPLRDSELQPLGPVDAEIGEPMPGNVAGAGLFKDLSLLRPRI